MNTNTGMATDMNTNNPISLTNDICADGICCFMSIPRNQSHLGIKKFFFRKKNASYGIKLLYTGIHIKDIVYNPCRCLNFYLKENNTPIGSPIQVVLRCGIFGKQCRPYTCKEFPDKSDSFMYDVHAPCAYNDYIAPKNYIELKHKDVFRLFYAIKDDDKLLKKIFPGRAPEETRNTLNQSSNIVKISAIWNENPSEYFLLEVPSVESVLYISGVHPKIKNVIQAYYQWQGHIESWLEKHYGNKWQERLNSAIAEEKAKTGNDKKK